MTAYIETFGNRSTMRDSRFGGDQSATPRNPKTTCVQRLSAARPGPPGFVTPGGAALTHHKETETSAA